MRRQETGHLWQNRFYSCPLDDRHQWEALRYVELNPVRAGLAAQASDWRWSSARMHLNGFDDSGFVHSEDWLARWSAHSWRDVLDRGVDDADLIGAIRDATRTGRPAADDDYIARAESLLGRSLRPQKRGPKSAASLGVV
jgi:putative transposase